MYPFFRVAYALMRARRQPSVDPLSTQITHHRILPWDMDIFAELNNGRTLTIFDMGRFALGQRAGLMDMLRRENWGLTVAGSSVRYRRRLRMFDRVEMRTRLVGWDARFLYMEQSMWRRGEATSHILLRTAITDSGGIVPTDRVIAALGVSAPPPPLPDWVEAWIAAENARPWPPQM